MRKYLFGLIVTTYVVSAIGIPVFLHYCGGELENVNYVVKGTTCCGEDEDEPMEDGCCKDESIIIVNNSDFTFQQHNNFDFTNSFCQPFYSSSSLFTCISHSEYLLDILSIEAPPPKLQASLVISTSVLRI